MVREVLDILDKISSKLENLEERLGKFEVNHREDKQERRIYFAVLLVVVLFLVVGISYENGTISFKGSELIILLKVVGSSTIVMLFVTEYLKRSNK